MKKILLFVITCITFVAVQAYAETLSYSPEYARQILCELEMIGIRYWNAVIFRPDDRWLQLIDRSAQPEEAS